MAIAGVGFAWLTPAFFRRPSPYPVERLRRQKYSIDATGGHPNLAARSAFQRSFYYYKWREQGLSIPGGGVQGPT